MNPLKPKTVHDQPPLPRLTARERAKLLESLGVVKAPGMSKYRKKARPKVVSPKPASTRCIPVRCIDTGETFPSISAAAMAHGVRPSHLCDHLKGYNHSVGKRKYEYVVGEKREALLKQPFHATTPKPVRCLDDGQEFRSMTACAKHYGLNMANLYSHLQGNIRCVNGKRFEYV